MTDDLTPQQLLAAPTIQPGAPALELHDIQGDILVGLQKNFERFIFFQIVDVPTFKSAVRSKLTHRITATREVQERKLQLRDHKNHGNKEPLPNVGLNVSVTASGLQKPGNSRVGMDEPVPNYPIGKLRSTLQEPQAFVIPTGGAYFFVPSISALQNELSA